MSATGYVHSTTVSSNPTGLINLTSISKTAHNENMMSSGTSGGAPLFHAGEDGSAVLEARASFVPQYQDAETRREDNLHVPPEWTLARLFDALERKYGKSQLRNASQQYLATIFPGEANLNKTSVIVNQNCSNMKREGTYHCPWCSYVSGHLHSFKSHLRSHTGEKPYICPLCDFRCAHQSNLNRHLRIHSGEKPFSCPVCGFRTARKGNLNCHMKVHTRDKGKIAKKKVHTRDKGKIAKKRKLTK